jgi:hypothetical protein
MKKITLPNEHWQGQQKLARAKLARSEAPDKQVEELTQQMIAGAGMAISARIPGPVVCAESDT